MSLDAYHSRGINWSVLLCRMHASLRVEDSKCPSGPGMASSRVKWGVAVAVHVWNCYRCLVGERR